MLSSLCMRGGAAAGHAPERAALLRHLLDARAPDQVDLGLLNARLETPVHCALRSGSLELLEVRPVQAACAHGWSPAMLNATDLGAPSGVDVANEQQHDVIGVLAGPCSFLVHQLNRDRSASSCWAADMDWRALACMHACMHARSCCPWLHWVP